MVVVMTISIAVVLAGVIACAYFWVRLPCLRLLVYTPFFLGFVMLLARRVTAWIMHEGAHVSPEVVLFDRYLIPLVVSVLFFAAALNLGVFTIASHRERGVAKRQLRQAA